ncbi:MAG TPA: mannose-1-phosphate guanylyltransferase [Terriglobales bacterium]|nr:mannose-1-phosphate guanylyltransferase [Terriglobales bacterium]
MTRNPQLATRNFYPVILAGGRGTRFWPRSRKRTAKQVLALDGTKTMIQDTVARLLPLAPLSNFWVITNNDLRDVIARQVPKLKKERVIAEPVGRNTAPAIGLAAFILERLDPDAVLGLFPADHVILDAARFRKVVTKAAAIAAAGENIVVMGMQPTRPETGYGYIESGAKWKSGVLHVHRFTEKPNLEKAEEFLASGNYFWNSGMFVWRARTLTSALREHLSGTAPYLEKIARSYGTRQFAATLRRLYPKCENISVDYAVLEPRSAKGEHASNLFCIPADFGWNDLGSWAALYEHHAVIRGKAGKDGNVIEGADSVVLDASGNYIYAPKKFVAAVGVENLVVVETEDALLITTRDRAQDVGKVVKHLDTKKLTRLL